MFWVWVEDLMEVSILGEAWFNSPGRQAFSYHLEANTSFKAFMRYAFYLDED